MAAMVPERSRTLHNFSLPPRLNWGTQRLLRCAKLSNSNNPSSSNDAVSDSAAATAADRKRRNALFRSPPPPSILRGEVDNQIEVIREKIMLDLRSEVDKIHATYLSNSDFPPPRPPESRPWNLRTRRSPATVEVSPALMPADVCVSSGDGGRAKFSVPLSRQEIEDDFVEMIGRRPPRKPKKRPRYVQKQLDTLFPGLWLSEISPDMYKVDVNPEPPK
ncbi:hypothetical protein SOVF_006190 isoform A [Spinacia oleracea]|nr:uncharacterized protein LOC110805532 isoform X2 [Spinacia oleracea]KNA25506.1 hypothetical protein SOVF_006190 isoform A [Spinacia oleracea]